jgi:hypothetical protein
LTLADTDIQGTGLHYKVDFVTAPQEFAAKQDVYVRPERREQVARQDKQPNAPPLSPQIAATLTPGC